MVLLTVTPLLQCPGGLQLGDVSQEHGGVCLLPELHEPKVHTGHTEGQCGTLTKVKGGTQRGLSIYYYHSNTLAFQNDTVFCEDGVQDDFYFKADFDGQSDGLVAVLYVADHAGHNLLWFPAT